MVCSNSSWVMFSGFNKIILLKIVASKGKTRSGEVVTAGDNFRVGIGGLILGRALGIMLSP